MLAAMSLSSYTLTQTTRNVTQQSDAFGGVRERCERGVRDSRASLICATWRIYVSDNYAREIYAWDSPTIANSRNVTHTVQNAALVGVRHASFQFLRVGWLEYSRHRTCIFIYMYVCYTIYPAHVMYVKYHVMYVKYLLTCVYLSLPYDIPCDMCIARNVELRLVSLTYVMSLTHVMCLIYGMSLTHVMCLTYVKVNSHAAHGRTVQHSGAQCNTLYRL